MLYTVSKLSQDILRNIGGALGYKIYSYTLTADKTNHLLNLIDQSF